MDEKIEEWHLTLRLNWQHLQQMVKEVRGEGSEGQILLAVHPRV